MTTQHIIKKSPAATAAVDTQVDTRLVEMTAELAELKQKIKALAETSALTEVLLENCPDCIYFKDRQSRFVHYSKSFAKHFPQGADGELKGKTDFDFYVADHAQLAFADEQEIIRTGQPIIGKAERETHPDGRVTWALTTKMPWRDKAGTIIGTFGISSDVTALKKAEEEQRAAAAELTGAHQEIKERELRFRTLCASAPIGISLWEAKGKLIYSNPHWLGITGLTLQENMDKGWQHVVHPDEAKDVIADWKRTTTNGWQFTREFRLLTPDGKEKWVRAVVVTIRSTGKMAGRVGTMEDISARKLAEQERKAMEAQLQQGQKLESIGRLAAGVAHEINTPTQYIGDNTRFVRDSFTELLLVLQSQRQFLDAARENRVTPELIEATEAVLKTADMDYLIEEIPKAVEQSLQGVERVAKIVRAMKEFSHPGTEDKTQVDLNHAIDSTLIVASNEWKYVAELVTNFDVTLPPVLCLPGEFNQVILNLTVNAAHAIADTIKEGDTAKGTITVSTKRDGDWAEVRIRDSGTGIPEHARAKIFDPFFTTKGVGKGTGQGLAIAHSVIVDKHGGTITFETELGQGTVFIIRIPIAPMEKTAPKNAPEGKEISV